MTEGVYESCTDESVCSLAFLICEARVFVVVIWSSKIDLLVGNVEVATKNDRLLFLEFLQVLEKRWIPNRMTEFQSREIALGIGGIDVYEKRVFELHRDHTTFLEWLAKSIFKFIRIGIGNIVHNGERLDLGKDRRACIARFLCRVPDLLILRQIYFCLTLLCFGLLQTQDVRLMLLHKRDERILTQYSPKTVYIPGDQFEGRIGHRDKM